MRIPARSIGLRPRTWRILAGCLLLGAAACSRGASATASEPDPARVRREIRDLMTALTPLRAEALPVEKSSWYATRRKTLERLRAASRDLGLEALRVYREDAPALPEVRAGLLDVAAHAAPEETRLVLVELVTRFGEHDLVRTKATEFLGETSPETAIEVLAPILSGRHDGRSYPPEDRLLEAWVAACEKTGTDPVPLLADIATDLQRPQEARHQATRFLGGFDCPMSRQALRVLMVESSGNSYIRRLATQSLGRILPASEFCELIESVQANEADLVFLTFLESTREAACR